MTEGAAMNVQDLAILHDCVLRDLRYDVSSADARTLTLLLECPDDLGKPAWDGQTLRITAMDVLLFRLTAWGHCWGLESLDAWRDGVSAQTRGELARLPGAPPPITSTVSFHSGTFFELACRQVGVEVVDGRSATPLGVGGRSNTPESGPARAAQKS